MTLQPLTGSTKAYSHVFEPPLTGMRLVRETRDCVIYEGLWGENGPHCVAKVGRDPARRAITRSHFRDEARVLRLLEAVADVPRLLHLDSGGSTLVKTRAPGQALAATPVPWLRDVRHVLRWGIALAGVLGDVHAANIFHGQLNPENVVVDRSTERVTPINFDEAVAQSHVDIDFVHPTALDRSLAFSAPEQTGRMGRAVDYRADLYSLGALMYWALTGSAPFTEDEPLAQLHALLTRAPTAPESLNAAVPPAFSAILLKLLAKEPQERYQSTYGVQIDLRRVLAALDGRAGNGGLTAGATNHRIRPAQPSRLFGRELDQARLERALDRAADQPGVVLVHGYSGAGKTSLVHALYPTLSLRDGIFVGGRFDEVQHLTPLSGWVQALSDLAEYWLAEPAAELQRLREQLHAALGRNALVLARLAPSFALVLWPPRQALPERGTPVAPRQRREKATLAALFDVIRARGVPVVLFIDNLQWADGASLDLFEAAALDTQRAHVLLVGAYRSNEVEAGQPCAAMLARIRAAASLDLLDLLDLETGNLGAATTHSVVSDVLAGTPSDLHAALAPLAAALHRRTEGNPFFVLQYLRRLCDNGQLRNVAGLWQWDLAAIEALPGSDNLVSGLLHEMQQMPERVRHLAGGCACLGGPIDIELLAAALNEPVEVVDGWLLPLLRRDILLSTGPADLVDASGVIVQARRGVRLLRFCHDRMQQAAYALLGDHERAQWHWRIARALGDGVAPAVAGASQRRFSIASHLEQSIAAVVTPADASDVIRLLLDAARDAADTSSFDSAWRFLQGAGALQARAPSPPVQLLEFESLRHRILFGLARHEEADASFAELERMAGDDILAITDAVRNQAGMLSVRLRWREACELILRHVAALGVEVPADDAWDVALDDELQALYAALDAHGIDMFEHLPRADDAPGLTAASLLSGLQASAQRWHPGMTRWAPLRVMRMALEQGRSVALPEQLALMGFALDGRRGDRAIAYALAQSALRLQPLDADLNDVARCRLAIGTLVQHCFEPLEQVLDDMRAAQAILLEAGEAEYVSRAETNLLSGVLETAPLLAASLTQANAAASLGARTGDQYALVAIIPTRQLARCLAGLTSPPGSFDDADFREADASADGAGVRARVRFGTYRALGAALLGDWPLALSTSAEALAVAGRFLLISYPDTLLLWLHALALAHEVRAAPPQERAEMRAQLDPLCQRFAEQALDCPSNFGHLSDLLHATVAWADGEAGAAMTAFERAIDGSLQHQRPYHHAFALELAAAFYAAQGVGGSARAYFARAVAAYQAWGAEGKLAQLRASAAPYATDAIAPTRVADSRLRSLDAIGLAEAAQILSSERKPDRLPVLLFDLVRRYAAAECGRLLWLEDGHWVERAGFEPDRQWIVAPHEARGRLQDNARVPAKVLNYLKQSQAPLLLHDVSAHSRFGRDAVVRELGIKSIVGLPIRHRGQVAGLLYLDNRQAHTELAPRQLETLQLTCAQFAIAYENAQLNSHLETMVAARTQELESSQAMVRAIIDNAPMPIFVKSPEGRYLMHNAGYAEAVGQAGKQLVGLMPLDFINIRAGADSVGESDLAALAGEQVPPYEMEVMSESGPRQFFVHKFPLYAPDGKVNALCGIGVEVTVLKAAEAELRDARVRADAANQAKGDFLANMSHEIRTPMNAILGMSHLVQRTELAPRQRNYVAKIERSAQSLLGIINDILDFSKIEAGKVEIEQMPFELGAVLDHLASVVGLQAEEKDLELLFDLPLAVPTALVGDALRLGQVLLNLGGNAVKFTESGEVVLRVEVVEDVAEETTQEMTHLERDDQVTLRFSIIDSGVGMTEEQRARMFQPFEQADRSTSRRYGGTGLGLAISRRLTALMGGEIGVDSSPGIGSRFHFTARFGRREAVARPAFVTATAHWAGRRALVVDDNRAARAILATMLRELGMDVEVVSDGVAALRAITLARAAGAAIELVLLDWKMPGMDAVECARQLQEGVAAPSVMMVSALAREELQARLAERRITVGAVLAKPVVHATLAAACARAFGDVPHDELPAWSAQVPNRREHLLHLKRLRGARVLLVEDNDINRELAIELLAEAELAVSVAANGEQALEMLAAESFDLVLMDCQMPVMDGYDATRALRRNPAWRVLPVIAMTANAMQGDREKALEAGMDDHIAKPIDIDAMFETLARWLSTSGGIERAASVVK